jgi:hypothetical protein
MLLHWIYFLQSSVPPYLVKIGVARDHKARISALRSGSPVELNLVLLLNSGPTLEGCLHSIFKDDRVRGEWFMPRPGVGEFVRICREAKLKEFGIEQIETLLEPRILPDDEEALELLSQLYRHVETCKAASAILAARDIERSATNMLDSPEHGRPVSVIKRIRDARRQFDLVVDHH